MNRIRISALTLALGLAWGTLGSARAEVGIATSGTAQVPYILAQITDDSDPWGGAWKRFGIEPGREVLNPSGFENGDGSPSLLVLEDGRALVAWSRNSASGFDVVLSVFGPGGWSPIAAIAESPANELDPSVALAPDGTVHLVYAVDGVDAKVVHRTAPADLSAWSAEARVSPLGQLARKPSAVWDGETLRVAYEIDDFGQGNTPRSVAVARLEGTAFQSDVVAVTYGAPEITPRIQRHAGRVWLDWVDAVGEVAWTRLDPQGEWETLRYEPFQGGTDQEFHVRPGLRQQALLP